MMISRRHFLSLSVAVPASLLCAEGHGQSPPPFFPGDRLTTWVPGLMAVGGVPGRTTIFKTLHAATYGNGTSDASSAIQAALDACPVGQVVQLSAGTFLCNQSFLNIHSGITVRGAGAGLTTLNKIDGAKPDTEASGDPQPLVIIGPNRWPRPDDTTSINLTADAAKGSGSITVADAVGLAAGPFDLPNSRLPQAMSWFCRTDRPTAELKEIAAVVGNVVTFTTPLHTDYRASHTAQLTRYTGENAHVKRAGVEGLTVVGGGNGGIRALLG